jgi:hypothetical protein
MAELIYFRPRRKWIFNKLYNIMRDLFRRHPEQESLVWLKPKQHRLQRQEK